MSGDSLLWWATVRQNGAEALERDADRRPCRRRTGAGRPRGRTPTAIRVGLAAVAAALVAGATGTPAFARPAAAAPPPSSVGAWSPVYAWPNIGIHLHLLPNGKVLSWDEGKRPSADSPGSVDAYVVDVPAGQPPGAAVKAPNGKTDLFCSGHTFLPDGRLFVSGGRGAGSGTGSGVADVNIFDYRTNGWTTTAGYAAQYARWYASTLALPTGEVLLLGGTLKTQKDRNPLPQVWQAGQGGLRDLTTALLKLNPYPRIYVAPDGRVVQVGVEQVTRFLDTSGTGKWTTGPSRKFGVRLAGTSAMYADGKVLTVGGGKYNVVPTKTAEVLDLDAPAPAWRYTAPMAYARKHANATVLPDGKVLVTGGSGSAAFNDGAGAVLAAETWDPATGAWTTMASMRVKRVYHSTAILLPDGRVLSAGGTAGTHGVVNNRNAEIYSPPYLFNGPRPTITSAPASVGYGQTFAVQTPDAAGIAKVTLVRLSSVTHSFNMNQRIEALGFNRATGGLDVTVPSNPNRLPPGHYMLFILNGAGVPSVATILQVG